MTTETPLSKKAWLDKLYYEIGKQATDFRITTTYLKDGEQKFGKWIPYMNAQGNEELIKKCNQREQLKNEIILDLDAVHYSSLIKRLKEDGLKFYAYSTQEGRAQQIHLYFNGLSELKKLKRESVREYLINKYGCDPAFKIDAHMVPIEYEVHWKTEKVKELIENVGGVNELTPILEVTDVEDFEKEVLSLFAQTKRTEATEMMVKDFCSREYVYTTRDDENAEMWIYKEGIYVPHAQSYIKEYCRNNLGEVYTTQIGNLIIDKIQVDTYIDINEFFKEEPPYLCAVQNGILNLKTKALSNFDPELRFFNKLPVKFKVGVDCPNIKNFFDSLFKDNKEIEVIQEIFGFLPYRDYFLEKSIMFYGDGRNGKGKTLELMKRFIGVENCVEVPLEDLENDIFALGEVFKKQANLCGDLSKTALKNTGAFKKLTGRDLITAPRKFKTRVSFVNYAKMIFSANALPMTYDLTEGFWSRWIELDFPFTFKSQKEMDEMENDDEDLSDIKLRDPNIIDKIVTPIEMTGLLNWALEGLDRLLKNNSFSYSPSSKEIETMWLRKSNSFNAFCMDCLKEDYDSKITKTELRRAYSTYCREHKLNTTSDKSIKYILSEKFGSSEDRWREGGAQIPYWGGIIFQNGKGGMDGNGFSTYTGISNTALDGNTPSKSTNPTKSNLGREGNGIPETSKKSDLENNQETLNTLTNPPILEEEEIIDQDDLIQHKCSICGVKPCVDWDGKGKPVCLNCFKNLKIQKEA